MDNCQICRSKNIKELLSFNDQAVGNRYLKDAKESEFIFTFGIGQCQACGLVQSINTVPVEEVAPRFNWITYSEPEGHLDDLVEKIMALPGLSKDSKIAGLSFKDDSTLERLQNKGYTNTWRIDPQSELGIKQEGVGIESIQYALTPARAQAIVGQRGVSDVIIVRHALEHAYDVQGFMKAINTLVKESGYIIYEVPDCTNAFRTFDYTTIWEEHTMYLTPKTFQTCLASQNLSLNAFEVVPYPFENSLIAIVQKGAPVRSDTRDQATVDKECQRGNAFAQQFNLQRRRIRECLTEFKKTQGAIALFGAGHLACTFVNVHGIKGEIAFVVDDNPNKKGMFMPGSRLAIKESSSLIEESIKLCLLSLNPLGEEKVMAANKEFIQKGGIFASIFPYSRVALDLLKPKEERLTYAS